MTIKRRDETETNKNSKVFKRSWNKTKRDSTLAAIIALFPGLSEVRGGGGGGGSFPDLVY